MATVFENALIEHLGDGFVDITVPGRAGLVRVYGMSDAIAVGQLLRWTVTARCGRAGAHHFLSLTRRRLKHGALFFSRVVALLATHMPRVDRSRFVALLEEYPDGQTGASSEFFDLKIMPLLKAWAPHIPDVRVWLLYENYSNAYLYYKEPAIFEAGVEELAEVIRIINTESEFLKLALCGTQHNGWVTEALPMTPSDVFAAYGTMDPKLRSALEAAEPWFVNPAAVSRDANPELVTAGFLKHVDGLYYRTAFHHSYKIVADYPSLLPHPPYSTVTALCHGIGTYLNQMRDAGFEMPYVLRRAGAVFDLKSLDRTQNARTWQCHTDTAFLLRDAKPTHVVVFMVDQWTFTDLCALLEKVAGATVIITGIGRFNNRAGYNVASMRTLYDDFVPVPHEALRLPVPAGVLAEAKCKLPASSGKFRVWTLSAPNSSRAVLSWLWTVGRAAQHRFVYVCDDSTLIGNIEDALFDIHGPPRGPCYRHKDGVDHAVVMMQVQNGPADGVVGQLRDIVDSHQPVQGKRGRIAQVAFWCSPPGISGPFHRSARFGTKSKAYDHVAPIPIAGDTRLVPKRIFTTAEAAGLNGCTVIYFGLLSEERTAALASVSGRPYIVNIIKGELQVPEAAPEAAPGAAQPHPMPVSTEWVI